jgi:hypothetical protein
MDELGLIRYRKSSEQRFGDVRKACERAGVSPAVLQSALKKNLIDDLTDKELRVIDAFAAILDERKSKKAALKRVIQY